MNKTFGLVSLLIVFSACADAHVKKPVLKVLENNIDLGRVNFDSSYVLRYTLKNEGLATLKIDTITSSCGCTVPDLSNPSIEPSELSEVAVTYKPVQKGKFSKSLVVKSNTEGEFTILRFEGTAL